MAEETTEPVGEIVAEKVSDVLSARIGVENIQLLDKLRGDMSRKDFVVKLLTSYVDKTPEAVAEPKPEQEAKLSGLVVYPETAAMFTRFNIGEDKQTEWLNKGAFIMADRELGLEYRQYINNL